MEKILHSINEFFKKQILKTVSLVMMLFFFSSVSANYFAQNIKLSLNLKNVELKEVFDEIEKQSDFYFMYNVNELNVKQRVTVILQNKTIYEVLDKVTERTGINYEVINKQIVLTPSNSSVNTNTSEDEIIISGYVFDEFNTPLPGATIVIKETSIGTITNSDGFYSISAPDDSEILVFSFIGYVTQEVQISGRSTINITMEPDLTDIDEVVVVGYGSTSKKFISGSIESIESDELSNTASAGIEGALQGKATGLQIIQNSGTPGSAVTMKIRGTASMFGGSQPLYVIDGIPMTTGDFGQIGFEGQGIDAGLDINPNDIESISILKDASATIYGARAANGVVLITTKKGKKGKTNINYSGYGGIQKEWKRLDLLNAQEWRNYVRTYDPGFIESLVDTTIDTDWQDEVFRLAPMMNHELSINGGSDQTQVFVSGGYFDQTGIVLGSSYEKYSGRVNVDHKITDFLSVSAKIGSSYSINDRIVGDQTINGVLPNAISKPPVYAVRDEFGNYLEEGFWDNPVAIGNEVTNQARTLRNISTIEFTFEITKGLSFKNQTGFDFYNLNERRYEPTIVDRGAESNGIAIDARTSVTNLLQQSTLNYIKTFSGKHNFNFLLGYSLEKFQDRFSWIRGSNFPSDNLEYLVSAGNIEEASSDADDEALVSMFGRIQYNLSDKYIADILVRRDGSSKFGENNKYATLPGISFAWRIGEEAFMSNARFLNELKYKISYGLTGNDQIGNHRHQNIFSSGRNYYNQPGLAPAQIPNKDLRWETSNNFNTGFDIEMFNSRISLNVEAYYIKTVDLLMPRPIPGSSGFTTYMANVGSLLNKGIEFSINTTNFDSEFVWTTGLNMSFNKNQILDLYNDQPITSEGRGNNAVLPNEPIGVFYMYKSLGVDPSTGELVFEDVNNDGEITDADRQIVGDPNPLFTGGFTNVISYKAFELRAFLQFSYGNDIFNGTRQYAESMKFGSSDNQLSTIEDRWVTPGDITYVPQNNGTFNLIHSSHFIEDGSYLRLKEVTLSYKFSEEMMNRSVVFSGIKIFVKGQNLLTFTNYSGLDPEVNYSGVGTISQGTDFFTFPQARAILVGLNLKF